VTAEIAFVDDPAPCLDLRRRVFIEEQGVAEADEVDGLDHQCRHLLARVGGQPAGAARLRILGDVAKIQRVCVLPAHRGTGLGTAMIRELIATAQATPGVRQVRLGSQTHAIGFYERLGFTAEGAEYDDAGIPHRDMLLPL
jgi:ElaA protein